MQVMSTCIKTNGHVELIIKQENKFKVKKYWNTKIDCSAVQSLGIFSHILQIPSTYF